MLVAMPIRILQTAAALVVGLGLLALAWPQVFDVQRSVVVAQAVSLRGLTALVAVAFAVLLVVMTLFLPRLRRFIAALVVMLTIFALVNATTVAVRGLGSTPVGHGSTVRVLTWNTAGGAPGAGVCCGVRGWGVHGSH